MLDGTHCPYCSGRKVNNTNSLAIIDPQLASEWHPTKNGDLTPDDVTRFSWKKVWWVCNKGHEYTSVISKRSSVSDCKKCDNTTLKIGYNDLYTKYTDIALKLSSPFDAKFINHDSSDLLEWKCDCKNIFKDTIANIRKTGGMCSFCKRGKSFPERFVLSLLDSFEVNPYMEKTFSWSDRKRYDFYIPSLNVIIETHGGQHYNQGFEHVGGRSLEEEQENDKYKYELAIQNGINPENYIVIDCRKSELEFIKNNIMNSRLAEVFNLNSVDWNTIYKNSQKSLIIEFSELYKNKTASEIAEIKHLTKSKVDKYLTLASELGWCNYDGELKNKDYEVYQFTFNGELVGVWESCKSVSKKLRISEHYLRNCLMGYRKTAYNHIWMFKKDYDKYAECGNLFEIIKEKITKRTCLTTNRAKPIIRIDSHGNVELFECINRSKEELNVKSLSSIYSCCNGTRKTAYGCKWMYKEDYDKYIEEQNKTDLQCGVSSF